MAELVGYKSPEAEVGEKDKTPNVVFISAARGTYDGLRSIKGTLDSEFGTDTVTVYNSVLFGDNPSPDRFQKMGAELKTKIENGPTTILAHSFAAAETMEAFKEIEKEDPDFFKKKENLDNLQLILISPAGFFKNWRQGIKYGLKYVKLGVQEAGMAMGRTVPGKTSILHGIVSTSVIPHERIARDDLVQRVRKISGKLSQADGSVPEIDAVPDRNYRKRLLPEEVTALQNIDDVFEEATDADTLTRRQRRAARKALKQRARITSKVVVESFDNRYADQDGDPEIQHEVYDKDKIASRNRTRLMWDTFIKGHVLGRMTEWQNAGMRINFVIPEQDTMMSLDDARNFLQGNDDRLAVTPVSTHMAPWAPQPRILVELVKKFNQQLEQDVA